MDFYTIEVTAETGETYSLERYKGKVLLIVNTATKCGLTKQFEELQILYDKYQQQDFIILGFPSQQFKQEVATGDQAATACRLAYGVTFPMHEIVTLNGEDTHPLFDYLKKEANGLFGNNIKWNFTKFLVDRKGNVVKRFAPTDKPFKFEEDIVKLL